MRGRDATGLAFSCIDEGGRHGAASCPVHDFVNAEFQVVQARAQRLFRAGSHASRSKAV